jgi:dihydrodipicolinate synthase/N-acetylneuraminate lyase
MNIREHLLEGQAIPALPLALDANRKLSEKHQRALVRYYAAAGCGGLAVAVHSTQFEIRKPEHGLFRPILELASQTLDDELAGTGRAFSKIAGVCGETRQAVAEAEMAREFGYHAVLASVAAFRDRSEDEVLQHCREVSEVLPLVGFYLQPAAGGRSLSYRFWRGFAEIKNAVAIKIAPFNRYQTLDVVRAVAESGRNDLALYTGNDDNIVVDLLTPFRFATPHGIAERRITGGLLGHWGVWTRAAVELFQKIRTARESHALGAGWLEIAAAVTDMNAAVFDSANNFAGCIPGILEVLRRQGLVPTNLCLNPHEALSPGQAEELIRVSAAYPELVDDEFVAENLDRWLD